MHNVWLIAKREYLERLRTKSFIVATLLIPLILGGLIGGAGFFATRAKTTSHVVIATADATLGRDLKQQLETGKDAKMRVDLEQPTAANRQALEGALHSRASDLAGYLWVDPPASGGDRAAFEYHARSAGDIATKDALEGAVSKVLTREGLLRHGLNGQQIDSLIAPVTLDTSSTGNTTVAFGIAYLFFFLMYMVIMLYGMNTARSIIEEKTSRVFEVLLATIKPDELLAGKILGVGAVGLTQIAVWLVAAALLANSAIVANMVGGGHVALSALQIVSFAVYFVFGFLIYSSIAAALGAMTNSEQELQQLNMFLVMPLAFCMLMLLPTVRAPDSPLARAVSLIPFCSPLLMNMRISLTQVPAWEIATSIVLMSVTVVVILWVSSRIYRVGILMYGKKPNLPEILRWLKYS